MDKPAKDKPAEKARTTKRTGASTCPICQKSTHQSFRPFCSRRCADIDLARWLNGHYAIPVIEEDGSVPDPSAQKTDKNDFFRE